MGITGYAFFVKRPRTIEDLIIPHLVCQEHAFEIVKTVVLLKIDYENFITDMLVDRQFLEDNATLCSRGEVWKCVLIQNQNKNDGVLVMPGDNASIGWAAYYSP